jgi:multiple sugar transport system ATP-binding protein
MAEIRVSNVQKAFGAVRALVDVDLVVHDQEFTVLLGPSGCGKTTLLRIIAGLEAATSGRVMIGGRDVTDLPPRARRISMVFQNYAVFPHLSVFENVAFGLRMQRVAKERIAPRVERAAELMHIEPYLQRYPSQLSGGQRQRVAVARALAVEPEVLLMDEPLSNLDALLRLEMRAELKKLLQGTGTTTIYVTHDQVEAMSLADRIAVMREGVIVQYDAPLRVYDHPSDTFVGGFIGNPPMNFLTFGRSGGRATLGAFSLAAPAGGSATLLLGLRPEDVDVSHDATPDRFAAEVVVVEPLGPHVLLTLQAHGQALKVTAPPDLQTRPGATLHLRPNPHRLRWMDPTSGANLDA